MEAVGSGRLVTGPDTPERVGHQEERDEAAERENAGDDRAEGELVGARGRILGQSQYSVHVFLLVGEQPVRRPAHGRTSVARRPYAEAPGTAVRGGVQGRTCP